MSGRFPDMLHRAKNIGNMERHLERCLNKIKKWAIKGGK